jgi:hypothetical protein
MTVSREFTAALWKVHGEKCFHCKEPKSFSEITVDHLIPSSLAGNPEKLATVTAELGLPDAFNLECYENLAPSCRLCNENKGDLILPAGLLGILLARIAKRLPSLQKELDKKLKEKSLDGILRDIAKHIDRKSFDPRELFKGLRNLGIEEYLSRSPVDQEREAQGVEGNQFMFTAHALDRMRERGFSMRDILSALTEGEVSAVQRLGEYGAIYEISARDGLTIKYKVQADVVYIISVFWRGHE